MSPSQPKWLILVLLLLSSTFPFLPSLQASDFVFDDLPAIVHNRAVSNTSSPLFSLLLHDFWGDPLNSERSHKSFRPLCVLLLRLLRALSPSTSPSLAFHAANLLAHCLNSLLAFRLCRVVSGGGGTSCALRAALVFALHPVHVEAVAECVGLADLLCSALVLGTTLICLRRRLCLPAKVAVPIASTCVAVLIKEQGIMIIPLVLAIDLVWRHDVLNLRLSQCKSFLLTASLLLPAAAGVLYLRLWTMDFRRPQFQEQDNPAAFLELRELRVLNRLYHYSLNALLLLMPDWLCFDWAMGCIPLIATRTDLRLLAAASLVVAGALLSAWCLAADKEEGRSRQVVATCLLLIVLPFLPSSNVFFDVGFVLAERNVYLSLLGHALLVSHGLERLLRRFPKGRACLVGSFYLLLAAFSAKSWLRSTQWRSELELFSAGLTVCPNNAKVRMQATV